MRLSNIISVMIESELQALGVAGLLFERWGFGPTQAQQ